jgi:hypothetical protein
VTRSSTTKYRADRARRTLHGIDEQVAKAARAVAGLAPVKRNRFIALDGAVKSVNRELEAKTRTLAGIKGYKTNLAATPDGEPVTADFVISSYHELWRIEQGYKQVKDELGWADFQVRSDIAIRRHQTLVNCAFSFCWAAWFGDHPPPRQTAPPQPEPGRGERGLPHRRPAPAPSWPRALRAVRAWLSPWTVLQRWWTAWSKAPPPPQLRSLINSVAAGCGLHLYIPN